MAHSRAVEHSSDRVREFADKDVTVLEHDVAVDPPPEFLEHASLDFVEDKEQHDDRGDKSHSRGQRT
jgi:hypothetical protein